MSLEGAHRFAPVFADTNHLDSKHYDVSVAEIYASIIA
jgi:hypothetical protein